MQSGFLVVAAGTGESLVTPDFRLPGRNGLFLAVLFSGRSLAMVSPLLKVVDDTVTTLPDVKRFPLTLALAVDIYKKFNYSGERKIGIKSLQIEKIEFSDVNRIIWIFSIVKKNISRKVRSECLGP